MRYSVPFLSVFLGLGLSATAMAETTPFETMAAEIAAEGQTGKSYVTLKNLKDSEVESYATRLRAAHGTPNKGRGELRVWEMPNPNPKAGENDNITVMLGPDKQGRDMLIIDSRGVGAGNNPRLRQTVKPIKQKRVRKVKTFINPSVID